MFRGMKFDVMLSAPQFALQRFSLSNYRSEPKGRPDGEGFGGWVPVVKLQTILHATYRALAAKQRHETSTLSG
jgi:hypothetical protein